MREPTDRERARATEIAQRSAGMLPPELQREGIVEALASQVLESAVRTYADDSWTTTGVEPTINLPELLSRLR